MNKIVKLIGAVMFIVIPAFCGGYVHGRLFDNGVDYSHSGGILIVLAVIFAVGSGAWIIENFRRS